MEENKGRSDNDQLVVLNILNLGTIRLAKRYCFKENLQYLSQISKLIVTTDQGDEILPDSEDFFSQFNSNSLYFLVDATDLELVSDDEDNDVKLQKHAHYSARIQQRIPAMEIARKTFIQQFYVPKYSHLFQLNSNKQVILEQSFLDLVANCSKENVCKYVQRETNSGIFSLVIFSKRFCSELIEEVEHFQSTGLPLLRPNSMNRYGLVLNEIGFYEFFSELLEVYLKPLFVILFGDIGASLDSHHSFIVQYKLTEDKKLNFHYDESEVTLNVCLGKEFTGGTLYFRGVLDDSTSQGEDFEFNHIVGKSLVHLGKHSHGAKSITSGERYNLIVWFRNSSLRTQMNVHTEHHHHSEEHHLHDEKSGKEEKF